MSDNTYLPDTDEQQALTDDFYTKDYTAKNPGLTLKRTKEIGDEIGLDWDLVDLGQFAQGIKEEMEHGSVYGSATQVHDDDYVTSGRIAYAHLIERADYYTALEIMEQAGEVKYSENVDNMKQWVIDQRKAHQADWDAASA